MEELLRYFRLADTATARAALADIRLYAAGAAGAAANRDGHAFDHPDQLDFHRYAGTAPHTAARLQPQLQRLRNA